MKRLKPRGDKLDKYCAHLFEGAELKPDEVEMLARYRKAHALRYIGYSKNQVLSALEKEHDLLSTSHIYAIIRESVELMGSIDEVDKKGERVIAIENYKLLANLARKNGDIKAAQEKADKLMGLFDVEQGGLDPQAFLKPVVMLFTTDVEQLKHQELPEETQDTEDIEYEDAQEQLCRRPAPGLRQGQAAGVPAEPRPALHGHMDESALLKEEHITRILKPMIRPAAGRVWRRLRQLRQEVGRPGGRTHRLGHCYSSLVSVQP